MPSLTFVVPQQSHASGGRTYNDAVQAGLRARGWTVNECRVAGDWPWPDKAARARCAAALPGSGVVVLDGLIGSCCPDELANSAARVVLLVHLPLPAGAQAGLAQVAVEEARAVATADVVVTTSRWTADDLRRRYGRTQVEIVRPGAGAATLALGSDPAHLLVLGALSQVKNQLMLLDALEPLLALPWRARLVGSTADIVVERELRQRLAHPRWTDRVSMTGELTGAALDQVWAATDLLLVPSLTETYGIVVGEALAHGIPAVVAAGTGAVEALCGGATTEHAPGTAIDPRDSAAWTGTVRQWLQDNALRLEWRERAIARPDRPWQQVADEFADVLGRLA